MIEPASSDPQAFLTALQAEHDAWRLFLRLLQEEQDALAQADADLLLAIAQRKSAQVAHLAALGEARNRHLRAATGAADQAGMDIWCERFDAGGQAGAARLWRQLLDVAQSAQRINEENGALINARLQHNQQALVVLRGAADAAAQCYGPDGQPRTPGSGRPLGKA